MWGTCKENLNCPTVKPLGPHRGIHRYTIGQRKGLGLALGFPAYVTGIDAKNQYGLGRLK
ncbi:MAG: tRNA methyl transferase PRC-barrel domain-containing protein [Syntrophomonadaceae bacterium]